MEDREDLEVFFWLLVQLLAEFGDMEEERREKVLEHAKHLLDSTIDKDGSDERLKDISHDLARLKDLNLTIIHLEVLLERVPDISIQIVLLAQLLLLLFLLPIGCEA